MGDTNIGNVSGGQNNFGGDGNDFHQTVNNYAASPELIAALAGVRARLGDFVGPAVVEGELAEVQREPLGSRAKQALQTLLVLAKPGTEAVTAVTALLTAVHKL